ncbi:MAG: ABC transporter substrate-binding protein, partial [Betaproteobacteria bacterium]|nr:ABC transporter substrate-binding protein [Betaproteobacteria bacterium]
MASCLGRGMNKRRKLVMALGAGALTAPFGSFAQQPTPRMHRIGFLGSATAAGTATRVDGLRAGLRDLGYVEGRNLIIDYRWAEDNYDRLRELVTDLVALKVDLIVTHGTPGTRVAKQTTTLPIVMAVSGDAVGTGLIASLARPGGNITGTSYLYPELSGKQLELLKEGLPRIRRVAVLFNSDNASNETALQSMQVTARSLKLELQSFDVRSPGEFSNAFSEMKKRGVEAVAIIDDPMIIANAKAAGSLVAKHRLPAIGFGALAENGGLMSYGVNFPALFRRAAVFVDKILKGARPADLPVEQPTTFELIINMKAAKLLGIKIPQSLLISS